MIDSTSLGTVPRLSPARGQRALRARLVRLIPLLALLNAACGAGDDHPPPAPPADSGEHLDNSRLLNYDSATADSRDTVAGGECEPGMTQPCRVYLPAHDGIQPCFVGEQRCVDAHWGLCDDALLVDANKDDTTINPSPSNGGYSP
jgi:hypothetical protein